MESIHTDQANESLQEDSAVLLLRSDIRSLLSNTRSVSAAIALCCKRLEQHDFDVSQCAKNGNGNDSELFREELERIFTAARRRQRNKIRTVITTSICDARARNEKI